ncbi:Amino Acid/Auxin Permease (AAAP) Family [Phytophthora infestans T30-4]|uniref:Amino Acid/Auxin Permease (AAAP) Family n=1 Tax=Phytophthora infestans (strain T30-4) TaxID=403677 RepID=D0P0A5_PHYIT|nr:Amino Acid/Auxin Permease (AAAP) Family [Phytophthora infestans T30-4]EEY70283.1 Amino Acid/Auxin Permease (AAAP) Family [Phytophthora infestans T30-4]|eukprot:XP_002996969.1 Amino Acid/Auxin Permease (AAAP) Family [Phytophthora infestans T30-4]
MTKETFFTLEDIKISFNLFCCVCGIGTLGLPGNFARAGPVFASIAMAFMVFANVYASIAMSKVMLLAPSTVVTFGDLGEWAVGKTGRWLCTGSQIISCVLIPCVFLVLGGELLDGMFPGAFSPTVWIILMATMVLPLCLVPTLKEGSGVAFAGCVGTLVADVIGVAVVMHGMRGHPSVPETKVSFSQVAGTFGNLALSYGAGIIIPDLQREHSEPQRMPRVITFTMVIISVLFVVLSVVPFTSAGCQISGNILYTIYPDSSTGLTSLGFKPHWGAVVLAYMAMQLHITTAFSVLINPAFYMAEFVILGMHRQRKSTDYRGANAIKYIVLRTCITVILVVLSILFKDHFSDFADFVGSSSLTMSCILLPVAFYLIKAWNNIPKVEKIAAIVVFVVCLVFGCYSTYTAGRNLFAPSDSEASFPYCELEYQNTVFYNSTAEHET